MKTFFSYALLANLLLVSIVCLIGCRQAEITPTQPTVTKPDGTFWEAVQNEDWALVRRWIEYDRTLVNSRGNYTDYHAYNDARRILAGDPRQSQLTPQVKPGMTPLFLATIRGNFEMVQFLCENGADLTATVNYSLALTPLHQAASAARDNSPEHVKIVEYLIKAGANVNAQIPVDNRGVGGSTPLDLCRPDIWTQDAAVRKVEHMLLEAGGRRFNQRQ